MKIGIDLGHKCYPDTGAVGSNFTKTEAECGWTGTFTRV